ncbi:phospholipid-binding lipoprotein MlaA [Burkholderia sp. D7]|uniref:ABC transporter n=2 Tax=Caballeronia udeis TaxID=1232866 RepID=A0A158JGS7_9BURK|nr:VacJ family lipoprotein [Caballeronia udeis]SAL68066.1 ABC transporter [Caballeronia udeis]SOE93159.1 phospholipid-binding lipoprotein MlaA [Burkholderia sp. D7]
MRMAKTPDAARTLRALSGGVLLAAAFALSGCATGPDRKPGDPLEPMNREIFKFNDAADKYVARPIATGYVKVTPAPLRTAISSFFSNIGDIGNFANNLLQLKITDATEDLMRIAINSTFGIGGLIDWATPAGLPKHDQDFGLTLGHYGVPSGPYLVLPLLGPSSVRDATNWIASYPLSPGTYLSTEADVSLFVMRFVSARADLLGATDILSQAALDKYAFVRDAYTQRRQYQLTGAANAALPDYGDESGGAAAPAAGASATAAPAKPGMGGSSSSQGLPNYADPGAAEPASAPAGK